MTCLTLKAHRINDSILITLIITIILVPFEISAGELFTKNQEAQYYQDAGTDWKTVNREAGVSYHYFINDGMNEAYTGCIEITLRLSDRIKKGTGNTIDGLEAVTDGPRGEIGLIIASGKPLQENPDWEVIESNLILMALPVSLSYIHDIAGGSSNSFRPYLGLGIRGIFGFERISGNVYKPPYSLNSYEWHDTSYRHSFAAHACAGVNMGIGKLLSLVFEARWTQAGNGRLKRGSLSDEEIKDGWGDVFADFQHPDFDFTGPSASMSLIW